jgi:hypothetical protein
MTFSESTAPIIQQHQNSHSVAMHVGRSKDGPTHGSSERGLWHPRSHFAVQGERQPLWRVDFRNVTLHTLIAENTHGKSAVYVGLYLERETGISHEVAVKKFPAPSSTDEQEQIHRELSVMFMASSRYRIVRDPELFATF